MIVFSPSSSSLRPWFLALLVLVLFVLGPAHTRAAAAAAAAARDPEVYVVDTRITDDDLAFLSEAERREFRELESMFETLGRKDFIDRSCASFRKCVRGCARPQTSDSTRTCVLTRCRDLPCPMNPEYLITRGMSPQDILERDLDLFREKKTSTASTASMKRPRPSDSGSDSIQGRISDHMREMRTLHEKSAARGSELAREKLDARRASLGDAGRLAMDSILSDGGGDGDQGGKEDRIEVGGRRSPLQSSTRAPLGPPGWEERRRQHAATSPRPRADHHGDEL